MTLDLPLSPLQTAIYSRLAAHGSTSGYTVYDASAVPLNASFPYVTIQMVTSEAEASAKTGVASETLFAVKVHTRTPAGTPGSNAAAYQMAANVATAITSSALPVSGHDLVLARPPESIPLTYHDDVGGYTHREVVLRFRYRTRST